MEKGPDGEWRIKNPEAIKAMLGYDLKKTDKEEEPFCLFLHRSETTKSVREDQTVKGNRFINWESIALYLDFVGFICISLYIWFGLKPIPYTETYTGIIGDYTPIIKAINNLLEASGFLSCMRFGFILIMFSFVIKIYRIICK